jgi:hypothetical protein
VAAVEAEIGLLGGLEIGRYGVAVANSEDGLDDGRAQTSPLPLRIGAEAAEVIVRELRMVGLD